MTKNMENWMEKFERSKDEQRERELNIKLEEWLKNGGKRENSPFITGTMFLPKENIEQCLKYGRG